MFIILGFWRAEVQHQSHGVSRAAFLMEALARTHFPGVASI